jgi:hypothetical protein
MEAAGPHAGGQALAMNPGALDLGQRDDAVLPRGDARDERVRIGWGDFLMHGYE